MAVLRVPLVCTSISSMRAEVDPLLWKELCTPADALDDALDDAAGAENALGANRLLGFETCGLVVRTGCW